MGEVTLHSREVASGYGRLPVLFDVSIEIEAGSVTALIGPNGAGKTTFGDCCMGIRRVWKGSIELNSIDITSAKPWQRVKRGMSYVPSGGLVFPTLSVAENLRVAGLGADEGSTTVAEIENVYARFPRLREMRDQDAGTLSGGQRQLLAMGRAFMQKPSLLIIDEPSLGLSPAALREVLDAVEREATHTGLAVLLIEQNVEAAFRIADVAHVLKEGKIVERVDSPSTHDARELVETLFLGAGGAREP